MRGPPGTRAWTRAVRSWRVGATALITLLVWGTLTAAPIPLGEPPALRPFRAFTSSSYWNTPLPVDAPVDQNSEELIAFLERDNAADYIELAGLGPEGEWGMPIYFASRADRRYAIRNTCSQSQPPEFRSIPIPAGAMPDPTTDAAMTVYELGEGLVYGLWRARYEAERDEWQACGGAVYYLESSGLEGGLPGSDEQRNQGHRGLPPTTFAVRYDQIASGSIDHVLKIALNHTGCRHVFPMTGDECGSRARFAPPEGARIRLKPSIDLLQMGLTDPQLVIAQALQRYGAVIGDQSGESAQLKVENMVAEGYGQLWTELIAEDALSMFTFRDFEFIRLGWRP
jgi:hypothetical protein